MVDPSSVVAPYVQLFEILVEQIRTGELKPGTRLPSIRDLAGQYRMNSKTTNKALKLLVDEGWAVVSPGRGIYVRTDPAPATPGQP